MNTFGRILRLTTFGESHGLALGGILDGVPAGLRLDLEAIRREVARRKPGQSKVTTTRSEQDDVEWLSGIFEGETLGTPIAFVIRNQDARSRDYGELSTVYRPSHADFTYQAKYGIRDYRGGGRASARETVSRVVAGAIARQLLAPIGIRIYAYTQAIGEIEVGEEVHRSTIRELMCGQENIVRCPVLELVPRMIDSIEQVRAEGDSIGGIVRLVIEGVPAGWGEPIYDKLSARLSYAMMSINAAKGVEIGSGFALSRMRGSQANDTMYQGEDGQPKHKTNHSGGILGGISNGERIELSIAFKPTATISCTQQTITQRGESYNLSTQGRHDPCVVPRAIPIVEAMASLVLADAYLLSRTNQLDQL